MRTDDVIVFGALIFGFALFFTAHVCICAGLAARKPRWRSIVALIALPLAFFWGLRERMLARSVVWLLGAVIYLVARAFATT